VYIVAGDGAQIGDTGTLTDQKYGEHQLGPLRCNGDGKISSFFPKRPTQNKSHISCNNNMFLYSINYFIDF